MIMQSVAVAMGGALGAVMRFWVSGWFHSMFGRAFPYGTLFINVTGSLLMGFLYVLIVERSSLSEEWRAVILIGFIGAFTTFSTFSIETLSLIEQGERFKAILNVGLSVVLCVFGTWVGTLLGRQL